MDDISWGFFYVWGETAISTPVPCQTAILRRAVSKSANPMARSPMIPNHFHNIWVFTVFAIGAFP